MDDRALVFLEVMIAIVVIGVLAFLVTLVASYVRRTQTAGGAGAASQRPQWVEFLLGLALLVIVAGLLIWQLASGRLLAWGESVGDWQDDGRALAFIIVMGVAVLLGLVVFVIYAIAQSPRRRNLPVPVAGEGEPAAAGTAAPATVETPSGVRLLGLLLLAVAFLLLNWIYVPLETQYALMVNLVYPASFAVALVLLFDKASRAWNVKGAAETFREWLLCDALVLLLVLGYLNLRGVAAPESYSALFWDLLNIAAFFVVFWVLDRKAGRFRFLLAYAYLIALPLLLAIWRAVLGVELPQDLGFWSSIWPVFILAIIFFVLEAVFLLVGGGRQVAPAVKDVVFVVLYAILLIAAIPPAAAA